MAELLVARLTDQPGIVAVIKYGVGPSVGAHTDWGTVGVVYAPSSRRTSDRSRFRGGTVDNQIPNHGRIDKLQHGRVSP